MKHLLLCSITVFSLAAQSGCDSVEDPAERAIEGIEHELPAVVQDTLATSETPSEILDHFFTIDHDVPVGLDRTIHVRETFTLRAWLTGERRALLMLPGPLVTGEFYEIDVDGYRGRSIIAAEGAFAFTVDFEGTGDSTYPADGRSIDLSDQAQAMSTVVKYIRVIRGVRKVDILGESWGGGVAAELCEDARRVRSCILASMLYHRPSAFADATFRSPGFLAFLDTLPDGYLPTFPDTYLPIVGTSPPAVAEWVFENQPDLYATAPLYDVFDLPFFDPSLARVPAILIQGEHDPNQPIEDSLDLVAAYGDTMDLIVVAGGAHVPRVGSAEEAASYWDAVLEFLDI